MYSATLALAKCQQQRTAHAARPGAMLAAAAWDHSA